MNFIYQGVEYAPGTKVRIMTHRNGEQIMTYYSSPGLYEFVSDSPTVMNVKAWPPNVDRLDIIEIIEPVYPESKPVITNNRNYPPAWDVEMGLIWYIVIMLVGSIFKDRLIIWVVATAYFFLWKNGFFGGKRK